MVKPFGSGSFLRIGAADAKSDAWFFSSLTRGKRPQPPLPLGAGSDYRDRLGAVRALEPAPDAHLNEWAG